MKRNSLTSIAKRAMAGCVAVAMILTGIVVMPKEAKAATSVYFATKAEYKMSDYWSTTTKKVPVKDGYVFGGWYNADQKTPLKIENLSQADDNAVAKFVPEEVLIIKTQIGTKEGETTASLRILSTVDSKNYAAVGFYYKLAIQGEGSTNGTTVYSKIKESKESTNFYTPDLFVSGVSQYFIAADVTDIQAGSFEKIVYARPYWITLDGTTVMGLARNNRVVDQQNGGQYTSVGINLLTDGKAPAEVAAGKIQITYNTTNYDVVGVDKTVDATNGGKYLFPEMECSIDDEKGTITFVGNATDLTKNLTADGLFANIRFEKASGAQSEALEFRIKTNVTEFCNWAEESVSNETFVVR